MVGVGLLLSDAPRSVPPEQQFQDILRIVGEAEQNGFDHIAIGQHFLYGDLRWLQPVPLLARLAAHVGPDTRLVTQIMIGPLYHPVMLAEEIATLDIVTEGRLIFGVGVGYKSDEFDNLGVPFSERGSRLNEMLELMPRLWTEDVVSHHGTHWDLDGVEPHLRPVQRPHPPIWVGAHAMAGVRRAGRFADGYAVPPGTPPAEVARRYRVVRDLFAERGKPFGPQPLRRNIMIADSKEAAVSEYARVAQSRYISYAQRGHELYDAEKMREEFAESIKGHVVLGNPDDVVAELTELVTTLPVSPLLVRPQWPTMDAEETVAVIRRMGRDLLPSILPLPARSEIPEHLGAPAEEAGAGR
ncbi:LLM class flavin-dependent oxidoreductase [Pseudonocardia nematodicida]|uniref:LLM class flavin-dependent oxidoreductase n=1 Tax=Pseudonocardia nematodicida TaxID=1206997 RepID=A0ABV1K4Z8_9PSEU